MADSQKRAGRPTKYDWDDKREICWRLYVEEQKSAAEIAQYFANHFNVDPSELPCRKGFLRQFHAWGFPSHTKKFTPEEESTLLTRIKELWEQNVNAKDIKYTLNDEGWNLKNYDFNKLWRQNGFRLRSDKGYKAPPPSKADRTKQHAVAENENDMAVEEAMEDNTSAMNHMSAAVESHQAMLRAQRLHEVQVESDQRLQARKRRRRIRGYGHLGPDAPGTAPRYASETSLDECKAYLHLTNDMYNTIRKDYQAICEEQGIIKKTQCADGIWEQSKQRLIRENLHLSAMMHPLQPEQDQKAVALDCICCDVTKRMRVAGKAITIAEGNNLLGFNPTESKAVRRLMYEVLVADNFESRLLCGDEHWRELRQQWFDKNVTLQHIVNENDHAKMKALDLLCSDAMKRYREDKNKRGERLVVQKNARYGPGPGPAWAATAPRSKAAVEEKAATEKSTQSKRPRPIVQNNLYPPLDPALDMQDPLLAAELASAAQSLSLPAYFRLAPDSAIVGHHPKMWLGKLPSVSISGVQVAATCKAGTASVEKVHGVVKNADGTEDSWLIESQDELEVYLQEAAEKPTFTVSLRGYV